MLTRTLTAVVAALPSAIKYKTRWLKPLYTSVLAWREPFFKVETGAGAITWHIDALTTQAYIRGAHEPHMQSSFLRLLRPGSVVYDVGAHLGFHALFCGLAVGPSGRVIAFEPDAAFRELAANVESNGIAFCSPLQVAVGAKDGVVCFRPGLQGIVVDNGCFPSQCPRCIAIRSERPSRTVAFLFIQR